MTNEMDLHSTNHVPKSGVTRVLVYYYAILIIAGVLAFLVIESILSRLGVGLVAAVLAAIPLGHARLKQRRLENVRRTQLSEHRKQQD